jgi:hypothetical protein
MSAPIAWLSLITGRRFETSDPIATEVDLAPHRLKELETILKA